MELLEQGKAVWSLQLSHAPVSWSTARRGAAGWHWALSSSLLGFRAEKSYRVRAGWEHGTLCARSGHSSVLASQLMDREVTAMFCRGRWTEPGTPGGRHKGTICPTDLLQLKSSLWHSTEACYSFISLQAAGVADAREGGLLILKPPWESLPRRSRLAAAPWDL